MAISEDTQAIITAIEAQTTAIGLRFDDVDNALNALKGNTDDVEDKLDAIATAVDLLASAITSQGGTGIADKIYSTLHYADTQGVDHTAVEHLRAIDGDTNHLATIDADTDHLAPIDAQTKSIDEAEEIQLKARSNEMGYREYSKDEVEGDITTKLG